jgi:hypothetical protein
MALAARPLAQALWTVTNPAQPWQSGFLSHLTRGCVMLCKGLPVCVIGQ